MRFAVVALIVAALPLTAETLLSAGEPDLVGNPLLGAIVIPASGNLDIDDVPALPDLSIAIITSVAGAPRTPGPDLPDDAASSSGRIFFTEPSPAPVCLVALVALLVYAVFRRRPTRSRRLASPSTRRRTADFDLPPRVSPVSTSLDTRPPVR